MRRSHLLILLTICCFISVPAIGSEQAQSHFDKIKSLAGTWHGVSPKGAATVVSWEVVSEGSAVLERMSTEGESPMITMYHLDGKHLMMTHYCSVKNQPRMRAEFSEIDDNSVRFSFLDITNFTKKSEGHMQKMAINIKDENNVETVWTFAKDGKEHEALFKLKKKS
ncbi:MAG: hypothetical protein DWQ05_08425 [Calditrichaeota bacterium]|nr:MAG: hypothetical protein DWQ05_08425 [Calditrichota bacterium]